MKQLLILITVTLLFTSCSKNYEILKEDINMNVCRMDVKLEGKMSKNELETISNDIRSSREGYDKVWISYFLPDFLPESGIRAWAAGSFTPELEVEIFGEDKPNTIGQQIDFPKYETVLEMLKENHDYEGHNLELIAENPLHIRVSTDFVKGDAEKNIIEQTKRDIIYVAFQAFAETGINEITVSSIPIQRENFNPNLPYDGKLLKSFKKTKTITREKALKILKKYIKTNSFKDLYQINSTLYLPNDKFDLLQFGQLDNVFSEL